MKIVHFVPIIFLFLLITCCNLTGDNVEKVDKMGKKFQDYWYNQGAEISRYALSQSRYGELHKGEAALIFVTEPFNPELQVKADENRAANIPILKLNFTRNFYTGIYPYSVMTSVFSPIDTKSHPFPLKISFSAQEWCGQVFMQFNLKNDLYNIQQFSYFEKEADNELTVAKEMNEDALWNQIRLSPDKLPKGNFNIIPSATYLRLMHKPLQATQATGKLTGSKQKSLEGNALLKYEIIYHNIDRKIVFFFEQKFPYRIQEWQETYRPLKYFGQQALTTRAVRTHTLMIDYWNKNKQKDRKLLKKLGLKAE